MEFLKQLHHVGKIIIESPGYIGEHEEDAAVCYAAAMSLEAKEAQIRMYEEELAVLREENARYKAALEQYSNPENWGVGLTDDCDVWIYESNGWDVADEALKLNEPQEK